MAIVLIDPQDYIVFSFSPNISSTSLITLTNFTQQNLSFKVKTTTPESYIVCPSQGVILPESTTKINITMQGLKESPGQVNHKFLVQVKKSRLLLNCEPSEIQDDFAGTNREEISSFKLCVRVENVEKPDLEVDEAPIDEICIENEEEVEEEEVKLLEEEKRKLEDEKSSLGNLLSKVKVDVDFILRPENYRGIRAYSGFSVIYLGASLLVGVLLGLLAK